MLPPRERRAAIGERGRCHRNHAWGCRCCLTLLPHSPEGGPRPLTRCCGDGRSVCWILEANLAAVVQFTAAFCGRERALRRSYSTARSVLVRPSNVVSLFCCRLSAAGRIVPTGCPRGQSLFISFSRLSVTCSNDLIASRRWP